MIYIKYNVVIHVGNMWAQNWENIYSIVQPFKGKPEIEVTHELKAQVTFTKISTVISMILYCIKQQDQHCPLVFYFFLFFGISITTQRQYFGLPRISLPVLGWILCRIVSGRSQCYLDRQMDGRSSATHLLGTWATAKILGHFDFFFGFGTPLILNDQKPAKLVIQSMYKHI